MEKIADYNVEGNYFLDGIMGTQVGNLSYFSDNRIIGCLEDSDEHFDVTATLLGVHLLENDSLAFVKFYNPLDSYAVIWYMNNDGNKINVGLSNKYNGYYLPIMDGTMFDIISTLIPLSEEQLIKLPYEIVNGIFPSKGLEEIISKGSRSGLNGKLNFLKK